MAERMPLGTAVVDNSIFISIFPILRANIRFDVSPITHGFQESGISFIQRESKKQSQNVSTLDIKSTSFQTNERIFLQRKNIHLFRAADRDTFCLYVSYIQQTVQSCINILFFL